MDDTISRQDFDKYLEDAEKESVKNRKYVFASALNTIRGNLRNFPSAQPEVICCKDCKWFGDIGCAISIVDDSDKPTGNDFCSYAERREE